MEKENKATLDNAYAVEKAIEKIADLQNQESKIVEAANAKIKRIRDEANTEVSEKEKQIRELALKIFSYYRKNKKELTRDGRLKMVKLYAGSFREYFTPRAVRIIGEEKDAIEELKTMGLRSFIRIKEEVDKEALLRHPRKVAGMKTIRITERKKKFVVVPFATEKSVIIDIKKS